MSMLDSFFNKGSRTGKCKTLLKLTIPRIRLLRNRREIQVKQMRKDIAKLLENGQEATARIRVEHIIREENMMAAQEILELFCELIAVRLPIIETQRECPLDLKEAISSICFAAPRCADLLELQQVQMFFAAKYGKDFVMAATELLPDCGVNRQIIELLSIRAPKVEEKLKLLKEIAEEHEVDWDPSATEMEFLKPHEDLLNGPSHFTNGSTLPLPPQKHDTSSENVEETAMEPNSDTDSDLLDLPEVPKDTVRAAFDVPSAPGNEDLPHVPYTDPAVHDREPTITSADNHPHVENKQFIPFVSPPSFPASTKQSEFAPPLHSAISDSLKPGHPASSLPPPLPSSPSTLQSPKLNEPDFSPSSLSSFREYLDKIEPATSGKHSESTSPASKDELAASISRTKSEINADLQDVLAAAQSAAETAERAAQAARAAANLAQVKISDLVAKRSNKTAESCGNNLPGEGSEQPNNLAKPVFQQQYSFGSKDNVTAYGQEWKPESPKFTSHAPQRLSSLEDDPYSAYPNLFSSKESDTKPVHNSSDKTYD